MSKYIHNVAWKLKSEYSDTQKAEIKANIKAKLYALNDIIPGIVSLELHGNSDGSCEYDLYLLSVFESRAALDAYQVHPEHKKVSEYVRSNIEQGGRNCVDMAADDE